MNNHLAYCCNFFTKKLFLIKNARANKVVLHLIFQEFQDNGCTLISCLLVNKTWCDVIVLILWKNPLKFLRREQLLFNVIISHLSDKQKNELKNQRIVFFTNSYQKPSFNYTSFCKNLNLYEFEEIIDSNYKNCRSDNLKIIKNVMFSLFINNNNTKVTHIYMPIDINHDLITGAKHYFSEIEFLSCNTRMNDDIAASLIEVCKSIKELDLYINPDRNNYGIVKLIESQKNLVNVNFRVDIHASNSDKEIFEKSLIKHASNIQYFRIIQQPTTNLLSFLVNLKVLKLSDFTCNAWDCLENLSLPSLQMLKAGRNISINALVSLIKNTNGSLIEIKIDYSPSSPYDEYHNKRIIQAIHQNCPKLKYLKLLLRTCNILELNYLLTNYQHLNGLYIVKSEIDRFYDWVTLFNVLVESSPIGLFKFKFESRYRHINLKSLKLFFDGWRGRHPMLLHVDLESKNVGLMELYKTQGIIKKYRGDTYCLEDFEWV
ncbi:hypothetical protein C1645_838573 [Glomus cerebriforme]|uniref:F-box domain-containing protein n=1 Tax=Glomus cerebriforme TaxID=658196 RepID=A0A397S3F8_9GLOM|nr:hypothetical protein C1645_838573 [Glomus cerebriforme]